MKTIEKLFLSLQCGVSLGLFGLFFITGNPYFLFGLVTFAIAFYCLNTYFSVRRL